MALRLVPGAFEVQPLDGNGQDPWSSPETPQFFQVSDASGSHPEGPPDPLPPGASICVAQYFDDPSNPQETANVNNYAITITLADGSTQKVAVPVGGGAGLNCNMS